MAGFQLIPEDVDPDTMTMVKEYLGDRQSGRVFQTKNETPSAITQIRPCKVT
jgi:hypothetical protein